MKKQENFAWSKIDYLNEIAVLPCEIKIRVLSLK